MRSCRKRRKTFRLRGCGFFQEVLGESLRFGIDDPLGKLQRGRKSLLESSRQQTIDPLKSLQDLRVGSVASHPDIRLQDTQEQIVEQRQAGLDCGLKILAVR